MRNTRVTAIALAAFMLIMPLAMVASAGDDGGEEGEPIMITIPEVADDGSRNMNCSVFFADNMVYGPQWRIGNFVRIEMMVFDMSKYETPTTPAIPEDICASDFELSDYYTKLLVDDEGNAILDENGEEQYVYNGTDQQSAILTNSAAVLPKTVMVSVAYMKVTITWRTMTDEDVPIVFEAGWDSDPENLAQVIDDGYLGREVNKAGHVIYGMLWDTDECIEDVYTVSVELGAVHGDAVSGYYGVVGEWYTVQHAIAHFYIDDGKLNDDEHPFVPLVSDPLDPMYADYKIGIGDCSDEVAWIELGKLIPQGSGGGNSEDSGGSHGENGGGNGDHELGQNGNGRRR